MASKPYEERIQLFLETIDRFMEEVQGAAEAARNHIAKGRLGDAGIAISHAEQFSKKAGETYERAISYARKMRS